jgi:hypothetical protein
MTAPLLSDAKGQVVFGNISQFLPRMKGKFRKRAKPVVDLKLGRRVRSKGRLSISFRKSSPKSISSSFLYMVISSFVEKE